MKILRNIAKCSPEGKLRLSSEAFEEVSWDSLGEMESMPDGMEKLRMYLKFADFCNETFMDRDAQDYYEVVLEKSIHEGVIKEGYKELAEEAYRKLAGLMGSEDEYVWETVSATLEKYRHLFEDNDIKK